MATSSSTDPVQTLIDLLTGTPQASWPNGTKPTHIEAWPDTSHDKRLKRADPSVYIRTGQPGDQQPLSKDADHSLNTETVHCDIYSPDKTEAYTIAEDVEAILEDYWHDENGDTEWTHGIRPQGKEDLREEHSARRSGQYVVRVPVRLLREDTVGTGA